MLPDCVSQQLPVELSWHVIKYLSTPTADLIRANIISNTVLPWERLTYTDSSSSDDD
jgi:hypothetical protein